MIEHTVTSGDTVSKVANYYGVRPFDLLSLNPSIYSERTYLPVGTKVVVPARKKIDYDPLHMNVEFSHRDLQLLIPTLQKKNIAVEIIGESVMKKPLYAFSIGTGKKEIFF